MSVNVNIPKGTRDFLPATMAKRNFIFDTLKSVFALYGYRQIETPAMENLSTLLGKYGEEGDKLLFKILNSGNFTQGINSNDFNQANLSSISSKICEKGLRYDLTVPFARFVVMYRNELSFPFRRFQIQPVWRADRPQKGRYREFYQCDVDVIGSNSLINEYELIKIIDEVFKRLKLSVSVRLNNRKVLTGLSEMIGEPDKLIAMTVAIDKIDKIGKEKVIEELKEVGFADTAINKLFDFLQNVALYNNFDTLYAFLAKADIPEILRKGLDELFEVYSYLKASKTECEIKPDFFLARGLSYYTGTILEVASNEVPFGSICGGGRYDDLTGVFGVPGLSGVGVSFGAERIYDVMEQLGRFDDINVAGAKFMISCMERDFLPYAINVASEMRKNNISLVLYPDSNAKIKKQFSYADSLKIPLVIIIGENEVKNNVLSIKNMETGVQEQKTLSELIESVNA